MKADPLEAVSLDRFPDPACSYIIESGEPVLKRTNDSFENIAELEAGDAARAMFDRSLSAATEPAFVERERVRVRDEEQSQEYLVRVVPPEPGEPGYILFAADTASTGMNQLGVDRMASVLSHDLRNPLDVARARLRAGRELGEDKQFEHVKQAHDRMERIIQDVLTLTRGEDVVTPAETVALEQLVEQAWQTVETNGGRIEIADDLPRAVVDRNRASRLFENLFRNAIEHGNDASDPEAVITVTVDRCDGGIRVADDGRGIPAGDAAQIFEPGYSSDEHGTGLGLAIVDRIATLHGWSVELCQTDGGACFEITDLETE